MISPVSGNKQLIVFARAPEHGAVKQRLARDIGDQTALEFYRSTLSSLLERMNNQPWDLIVSTATDCGCNHPFFNGFNCIAQAPGDLGYRMTQTLDRYVGKARIIIGSDIPSVKAVHISAAFAALAKHDVVFGPACDGGFWLVGCSAGFQAAAPSSDGHGRQFMQKVRWSTRHALADTIATLPTGCRIAKVNTLMDVDDGESYARYTEQAG